jgi:4-hydroxy-tetrahydrodipicolinate reductase
LKTLFFFFFFLKKKRHSFYVGSALCEKHGVGLTVDQFNSTIAAAAANGPPCYAWNSNETLAAAMGLTIKKISQSFTPTIAKKPLRCEALKKDIPAGHCTGMNAT